MASCSDLSKLSLKTDYRSNIKAIQVPILTGRKLIEPFNRLKNRANLFRRKNYLSQLDISDHRSSLPAEHISPSLQTTTTTIENNNIALKRSNSMICPQQSLPTLNQRNSTCPIDNYRFIKSSSNRYWTKHLPSKMSNINEQDVFPSNESLNEKKIEELSSLPNNNNEQKSVILPSPQLTKTVIKDEQTQQLTIPPVTFPSSDNNEAAQRRHQLHSYITFLHQRESICSSNDEPFYDCKQQTSPIKPTETFDMSLSKTSTCTMTGKSLTNLDECLSTASSEDKGVQTTFNDSMTINSSTSLSSSSTSIQTDSLENKPKLSSLSKKEQSVNQRQVQSCYKWPHLNNRLLGEQTCIYWVNYLGKIEFTNTKLNAVV